MPSYAYYEEIDALDREEFTRADVMVCDDTEKLLHWWNDLQARQDTIRAQLEARAFAKTDDADWVRRAARCLAYVGAGQTSVRRRMGQLGCDPNPSGTVLHRLSAKLSTLNAEVSYARHFIAVVADRLPQKQSETLHAEACERLAADPKRGSMEAQIGIAA